MSSSHLVQMLREVDLELPRFGRVLIVDDEPDNLITLEALLEDDWEVWCADSGEAALALLEGDGPADLVIADQRMPGMQGVELLTRVAERWPDTVRVVLTGFSDLEPMLTAINRGSVYRFLLKPYDAEQMRQMVAEAMDLRTGTEALRLLLGALVQRKAELERTLAELSDTQRQLVAAERVATVGGLMSGVVHDLSNLGMVLVGVLPTVSDTCALPPRLEAAVREAWQHLKDLLAVLRQVVSFAQRGVAGPRPQALPARELVDGTLELFALEELGSRCDVTLEVAPGAEELHADPGHLRQALLALLRNAFQASEPGDTVVVAVRPEGERDVVIEVHDRGVGMDEATLARAAEPFFSGFDPPGLGLGLEVVRLAAATHGGRVDLSAAEGGGTVARLSLAGVRAGTGRSEP